MFKVLLVVPYPKLEETAKRIYKTYFYNCDFEMNIRVIRAEQIENKLSNEKYDLIIGRGHSAFLLKKREPYVPVIEIPITGYDILRSLILVKKKYNSKKVAIILPAGNNHDETLLKELLGMDVTLFEVSEFGRIQETVREIKKEGYDTIIGGYSVTSAAKEENIRGITIETGEEAVIQSMNETLDMLDTIYKERERRKIYHTITQISKEGVIYVNNKGVVELTNKKILQMVLTDLVSVRGKKIEDVYPCFADKYEMVMKTGQPLHNDLQDVDDTTLTVDYVPVIVEEIAAGVVITCQTVKKIQQIESQIRKKLSAKGLIANYTFSNMIHKSAIMNKTVAIAGKFARVSSNILIVGETGTGKELMAQSVHNASERNNGPFVAVNCAAIPENLLESELFGYADGAFTGSKRGGKMGYFEQAHGGTLFLDEISELPVNVQGKLLRVLQERQVRRIGDDKVVDVDARIIAATNKNLRELVAKKEFRQDLLYRIDVLEIYIPPLHERKEDIVPLFEYFLKDYNHQFGKMIRGCTNEAKELLVNYNFKGNIRELKNITERLAVMCEEELIDENLMQMALYPEDVFSSKNRLEEHRASGENVEMAAKINTEEERIRQALKEAGGRKGIAAEQLGMDRSTLWRKMKIYNIE